MKLLAFIPIKITLLLILGIIIGHYFQLNPFPLLIITIISFGFLAIFFLLEKKRSTIAFGLITAFSFTALGAFCYADAQPIFKTDHYSKIKKSNNPLWTLKISQTLKPNSYSQRYIAKVIGVDQQKASGSILINIAIDSIGKSLQIDDELYLYAKLKSVSTPLNPHQFNYSDYMSKLGVYDQLRVEADEYIKKSNPTITLFGKAAEIRNHIITNLKKADFGKDELAIIQALLLGQRSDISEETYTNYQKAGGVHILAVSGLHIGILLMLIQFLLSPLKYVPNGKSIILLLSVILLWAFAFLAGFSASIIRATTMFTFVAYALYLNRPSNSFNILSLSVLFILLFIDPNLLFQVGFQMSYAAVFAILWIFPLLQKFWNPKNKIIRYFWQLLSVSAAAQLGVLPISIYYFHQFPGLFFISNLIIVPALGLILGLGIIVIILSSLNWLPIELVKLYNFIISIMNSIVGWVAQQEAFLFSNISFDAGQLLLAISIVICFALVLQQFNFKSLSLFLVSLLCFQAWTIFKEYTTSKKQEVLVLHQTKNSILLHRNGHKLSVLTNNENQSERLISDYTIGERIQTVQFDSLKNTYSIFNKNLIIVDSLGLYPTILNNPIVLLKQSPKINLDRFIKMAQPNIIIADGSNYSSYIQRWRATCLKHKIPFHYTGEKGFYEFELNK